MVQMVLKRSIRAPVDKVFRTVAEIEQFSQAVPHIVKVEFLSDSKTGLGTRFRETRLMKGKEQSTDLEVTEWVENERVRIVTDTHGTVWDTVFTVQSDSDSTELTMVMDARAHRLLSKIMNPLIMPLVKKEVAKDMDSVKVYCEQ
jgi:ribosome-associated toxin RatA of RatAB toxin-antitoxin module